MIMSTTLVRRSWFPVLALGMVAAAAIEAVHGQERAASPAALATKPMWIPTGALVMPRSGNTATLLPNGKVLVAGGYVAHGGGISPAPTASAELYDPATGKWSLAASMSVPRAGHTATLLASGRVLVVGGEIFPGNRFARSGTAEIYDPSSGVWSQTGDLTTTHDGHTATLLQDGKVLVAGGIGASILDSADLYDPATGLWKQTGRLAGARFGHTATLLLDGKVLVVQGGSNPEDYEGALPGAELYDPVSATWSTVDDLGEGRTGHTATLLPDGKVLVAGGRAQGSVAGGRPYAPLPYASLATAKLFDPLTKSWRGAGALSTPRDSHSATLLPNGHVLVAGGITAIFDPADGALYKDDTLASAETYDPNTDTWTSTGSLSASRAGHSSTLLADGRVLVAGGGVGGPLLAANAELYGESSAGTITSVFTGSWYDPAQSGHGLLVEVLPDNKFLAAWFAFNPAGTEQAWFLGVGSYSGNTATIDSVVQPTGGRWIPDFDSSRVVNNPWGTLTLTFTDCNRGRVDFDSTAPGYGRGSMNLTRLSQPAGLACP